MGDYNSLKKLLYALSVIISGYLFMVLLMAILIAMVPQWTMSTAGKLTLQAIQTIILFGITAFIGIRITEYKNPIKATKIDQPLTLSQGLIIFLFAICAIPGISWMAEMNGEIELPSLLSKWEEWMKNTENAAKILTMEFINTNSPTRLFTNLVIMAFLPAVCEEFMFRGWLQRRLYDVTNTHAAIWIAAFIFSAIHLQFYGFIPRMVIGAGLGYIYYYSKSLWGSILAHFVNNATAIITGYISYNGYSNLEFDKIGTGDMWPVAFASIITAIVIIILMSRQKNNA